MIKKFLEKLGVCFHDWTLVDYDNAGYIEQCKICKKYHIYDSAG